MYFEHDKVILGKAKHVYDTTEVWVLANVNRLINPFTVITGKLKLANIQAFKVKWPH